MEWRFFTENALENRRECSEDVKPVIGEQVDQNIAILTVGPHANVTDKTDSVFVNEHFQDFLLTFCILLLVFFHAFH